MNFDEQVRMIPDPYLDTYGIVDDYQQGLKELP